jgi:hypothetical protein
VTGSVFGTPHVAIQSLATSIVGEFVYTRELQVQS